MKRTVIKERKYKGYLLSPTLKGIKVYRKSYYIGEYASIKKAMAAIDIVLQKKKGLTDPEKVPDSGQEQPNEDRKGQLSLF
jgi:hypothetical protein